MLNDISQIGSGSGSLAGQSQAAGSGSDIEKTKMQFLTLLLAQLKNQDPLSPADTDQMSQQMMSLGQLEQLFDLNKNVKDLTSISASSMIASYSAMVGKGALAKGNSFEIKGEQRGSLNFAIPHVPQSATIRVFDGFNNLVQETSPEVTQAGMQQIPFNGMDQAGQPLADGYYTYTVEAYSDQGDVIPVETYSAGTISSFRMAGGVPVFGVGKSEVGITDIERVF